MRNCPILSSSYPPFRTNTYGLETNTPTPPRNIYTIQSVGNITNPLTPPVRQCRVGDHVPHLPGLPSRTQASTHIDPQLIAPHRTTPFPPGTFPPSTFTPSSLPVAPNRATPFAPASSQMYPPHAYPPVPKGDTYHGDNSAPAHDRATHSPGVSPVMYPPLSYPNMLNQMNTALAPRFSYPQYVPANEMSAVEEMIFNWHICFSNFRSAMSQVVSKSK